MENAVENYHFVKKNSVAVLWEGRLSIFPPKINPFPGSRSIQSYSQPAAFLHTTRIIPLRRKPIHENRYLGKGPTTRETAPRGKDNVSAVQFVLPDRGRSFPGRRPPPSVFQIE